MLLKMKYDFETVVDRRNTGSSKWNGMEEAYGAPVPDGIIPFSVADMELKNPPEIIEGLKEHLDGVVLGYTRITPSYENAVAGWMKRRHNWDIRPEWIVPFPGVVPALFTAVRAFTEPGDGVIIMTPVYYPFNLAITTGQRTVVESPLVDTGDTYEIDYEDLRKKAGDPKNKMLILCSPHNPIGRVWKREELKKIGNICLENDVLVVSDEIHFDLILPGYKHTVLTTISEDFADRWIVCTAPSKTFNLAGMAGSNIIIKNEKVRQSFQDAMLACGILSIGALAYTSCELAYTRCEGWLDEFLLLLDANRKLVEDFMRSNIPEIKVRHLEGTYLQWWDCRGLHMDNEEMETFMQKKALLFFDEGYIFGKAGSGFERINLACPTKALDSALHRLLDALKQR